MIPNMARISEWGLQLIYRYSYGNAALMILIFIDPCQMLRIFNMRSINNAGDFRGPFTNMD